MTILENGQISQNFEIFFMIGKDVKPLVKMTQNLNWEDHSTKDVLNLSHKWPKWVSLLGQTYWELKFEWISRIFLEIPEILRILRNIPRNFKTIPRKKIRVDEE